MEKLMSDELKKKMLYSYISLYNNMAATYALHDQIFDLLPRAALANTILQILNNFPDDIEHDPVLKRFTELLREILEIYNSKEENNA